MHLYMYIYCACMLADVMHSLRLRVLVRPSVLELAGR